VLQTVSSTAVVLSCWRSLNGKTALKYLLPVTGHGSGCPARFATFGVGGKNREAFFSKIAESTIRGSVALFLDTVGRQHEKGNAQKNANAQSANVQIRSHHISH
jgi:hypothetical protein